MFVRFGGAHLASQTDVEHRCGLGRRSNRDGIESALVGFRDLAGPLRDVVHRVPEAGTPVGSPVEIIGYVDAESKPRQVVVTGIQMFHKDQTEARAGEHREPIGTENR